jgi:transposase InsO family protein
MSMYTTNPNLPRVHMDAVRLVRSGWSTREAARHFGFTHSAVVKWMARAGNDRRAQILRTRSSRPHHHPRALSRTVVEAIRTKRFTHHRCAEVVHQELKNDGVVVSLSSVKRTLQREGLLRQRSPWKRLHRSLERPQAVKPGDLVELDTIHVLPRGGERFYVYTLIDVVSRWAYAKIVPRINTHQSLQFLREAQGRAPFTFTTLQSDHGSEFSTNFSERSHVVHRHSRVRQPNDNGHLERFNRTLQEECLTVVPTIAAYRQALRSYLPYYNTERLHLGLNLKTPLQVVPSY